MTTDVFSLFDQPGLSHRDDPETSRAAAQAVAKGTRRAILAAFLEGPATDDEAGDRIGLANYSQRRRCSELRGWGLIEPTGETRTTHGGGRGLVCRITEKGREALRA